MNNYPKIHTRHAKGPFAMAVVFSFTGAAILASIIFSLLLFLSIDKNPLMMVLFGALAVIFELGKFFAWYEFGERVARRDIPSATSALVFYGILAAISIGGSIGGINSATNTAQKHVSAAENKVGVFNLRIEAIEKQIDLNNIAASKYIELNRIAVGVARIQKENAILRQQQVDIVIERDNLPVANEGSVFGLIGSLANVFHTNPINAQLGLVIFLSVLLDLFAAFFVGLIGEELRFKKDNQQKKEERQSNQASLPSLLAEHHPNDSLFQEAIALLSSGTIRCSKAAVSKQLALSIEETNEIFDKLLAQGFVNKKANHHFNWLGNS